MKVVCFDLDDTLYKEIDYLKSAYREIASYAADYCRGCPDSPIILSVKAYEVMLTKKDRMLLNGLMLFLV